MAQAAQSRSTTRRPRKGSAAATAKRPRGDSTSTPPDGDPWVPPFALGRDDFRPEPPLPPWPMDTKDRVFLGRALERIAALLESAGQPHDAEAVRNWIISRIERRDLKVYARIIADTRETRMGLLDPSAFPPEAWVDFLTHFTAYLVDRRPWVSVRQRRRIRQPHWLFVGKDGLEAALASVEQLQGFVAQPSSHDQFGGELDRIAADILKNASREVSPEGGRPNNRARTFRRPVSG
jgi:hypothetical protein